MYDPISTSVVDLASVEVLAEYRTMLLVEVPDGAEDQMVATFAAGGVPAWHRPEYDEIAVNGYRFASGSTPDLPTELCQAGAVDGDGLYLVQMVGPIRSEWREGLERSGEIVAYYPENTFLVRGNGARLEALLELRHVQHVSAYEPAFKIHRELLDARSSRQVIVQLDGAQELSGVTSILSSVNEQPVAFEAVGARRNTTVTSSRQQLLDLSRRPEVLWIEPVRAVGPSDERIAKTAAGLVEAVGGYPTDTRPSPVSDEEDPPVRDESKAYARWLADHGFCSPNDTNPEPSGCLEANGRVALVDGGIDRNQCTSHGTDCTGTVLTHGDFGTPDRQVQFFCAKDGLGDRACQDGATYVFDDVQPHGTYVASIIAGRQQLPGSMDGLGYRDGTGLHRRHGSSWPRSLTRTARSWTSRLPSMRT